MKKLISICLIWAGCIPTTHAQWQTITTSATGPIYSLFFISPETGFIGGQDGMLLKTTDGGDTWTDHSINTTNLIYSIHFVDANHGFLSGSQSLLYKTTDGGQSWSPMDTASIGCAPWTCTFFEVEFLDENTGYIGLSKPSLDITIAKTTDGGDSWTSTDVCNTFREISVPSSTHVFGAGGDGCLQRSIDGGQNWTFMPSDGSVHWHTIHFTDENTGFAAGSNVNPPEKRIYRTQDGGASWDHYATGRQQSVNHIRFANTQVGIATGSGFVMETDDGGDTWSMDTTISGGYISFTQNIAYMASGTNLLKKEFSSLVTVGEPQLSSGSIQIFPNPARDQLNIRFNRDLDLRLEIFDLLGHKLASYHFPTGKGSVHSIDISGLADGIYFCRGFDGNRLYTKKIVVDR